MTSTIGFTKANYKIYESGTSTDIPTLERTGDSTAIASVKVSLKSGTAIVGKDVNSFSQTISWGAGDSSPKQINLAPIADSLEECGEYVTLSLSTVRGASYGLVKTTQVEIADTKTIVSGLNDTDLIKISRNDSSSLIAFSDFKESVGTLGGGGGVSPITTQRVATTLWIDTTNGDDSNDGSSTSQFKTWARAKQELMKGIISYAQVLVNGTLEAPIDIDGLVGMSNNPRNKSTLQIAPQWGTDTYEYTIAQTNSSDYRLLTPNRNVSVDLSNATLIPSSKFNLDQLNLYLNNITIDCSSCNWDVLRFTNGYYEVGNIIITNGSYKELMFGAGSYGKVSGNHSFNPEWEGTAFEFENGSNIYFQGWTGDRKYLYAYEGANVTLRPYNGSGYSIDSSSYPIKTTEPLPDIKTIANAVVELQKIAIATAPVKEFPWVPSDLNGGILYYLGNFATGLINPHTAGIISITADSYYSGHEPYRLLDNDNYTNWDAVGLGYHWLQIDFKNRPAIINQFVFLKTSYMNNIADFVLNTVCKVSNDGENWTELLTLTQSNVNYADSGLINNTTAYRYIRWEQVADVNYWNMGGLQLFGFY
ncbi:MAG: discoidin domain-containing protein [Snowella sp.]|nr:discoidin domain-containing protein [Snowella sp.]